MRRATRLLWVVLGVCLLVGAATSLIIVLTPADRATKVAIRELSAVVDMLALVVWMLVFAAYWTRRSRIKRD